MAKKNTRNTRGKIVNAAWKLFYEQGYEDTTVEEIIELSHTSKGSFYHYFDGKDALLSTLSLLFDEKYEELMEILDARPQMSAMDRLLFLNSELLGMIENSISMDLLARLLSTQPVSYTHLDVYKRQAYDIQIKKNFLLEYDRIFQILRLDHNKWKRLFGPGILPFFRPF